jgi:ribosomal protein S18 acetylase RimI-like enzyme
MEPDDADGIVELVVAAEMFSPEEADVVRGLLDRSRAGSGEDHACLVDEQDGRIVGVAYYRAEEPADRVWDLTMIAVAPGLQGRGRGGALLGRVEDDLRDRGQRLLMVDTSGTAQYARTREFYGKYGYLAVARVPDYWSDGDDLVVFVKRLPPSASTRMEERQR